MQVQEIEEFGNEIAKKSPLGNPHNVSWHTQAAFRLKQTKKDLEIKTASQ